MKNNSALIGFIVLLISIFAIQYLPELIAKIGSSIRASRVAFQTGGANADGATSGAPSGATSGVANDSEATSTAVPAYSPDIPGVNAPAATTTAATTATAAESNAATPVGTTAAETAGTTAAGTSGAPLTSGEKTLAPPPPTDPVPSNIEFGEQAAGHPRDIWIDNVALTIPPSNVGATDIVFVDQNNPDQCYEKCKTSPFCRFFSYWRETGACNLFQALQNGETTPENMIKYAYTVPFTQHWVSGYVRKAGGKVPSLDASLGNPSQVSNLGVN